MDCLAALVDTLSELVRLLTLSDTGVEQFVVSFEYCSSESLAVTPHLSLSPSHPLSRTS